MSQPSRERPAASQPKTLGEYRTICAALCGEDCQAVQFLDRNIVAFGIDYPILVGEKRMWQLLKPMLPAGHEKAIQTEAGQADHGLGSNGS